MILSCSDDEGRSILETVGVEVDIVAPASPSFGAKERPRSNLNIPAIDQMFLAVI